MPRNKTDKGRWEAKDNKTLIEKSHLAQRDARKT